MIGGALAADADEFPVSVVADASALQALEPEWNALLRSSRGNCVFLTWEWISTWWSVYGRSKRLHVLTVRDAGGQLIGLAPLQRQRRTVLGCYHYDSLEFIGHGGDVTPEYLDFILDPRHEARARAALMTALSHDRTWTRLDLRPMNGESATLAALEQSLRDGDAVRRLPDSVCPILTLPASSDEFLAQRSRNYRKKIGEYERKLARDGIRLRRCGNGDELSRDMASLRGLHRKRWSDESRAFRSPEYCRFHDEVAQAMFASGHLRLFVLEAGERPVAVIYCFGYGGRYSYYQAGWDPDFARYRLGLVLMHKVILEAIADRATVFDFLSGREPYKYRWANGQRTNQRLTCWRGAAFRAGADAHNMMLRLFNRG